MMNTSIDLDAEWSVNEILARFPASARVLNAWGVDTCCGGHHSLAEAAREGALDLDALVAEILGASRESTR
jgi:regulator of cell morphogenesis and NO signaling